MILHGAFAAFLITALPSASAAQDAKRTTSRLKASPDAAESDVAKFCTNIAQTAIEARVAWQMTRLKELQGEVTLNVANLKAKEEEARDWVIKRQDMQKKAEEDVVQVYAKMQPEAAASQLVILDDESATAILTKLNPRVASLILGEMDASKAAKLTDLMLGATNGKGT